METTRPKPHSRRAGERTLAGPEARQELIDPPIEQPAAFLAALRGTLGGHV
jgi:hypothetical protein